jgi:hypothetical protein
LGITYSELIRYYIRAQETAPQTNDESIDQAIINIEFRVRARHALPLQRAGLYLIYTAKIKTPLFALVIDFGRRKGHVEKAQLNLYHSHY